MAWRHNRNGRNFNALWVVAPVVILLIIGTATWLQLKSSAPPKTATVAIKKPSVKQKPQTVVGRYLFTGTTSWGRAIETEAHGNYAQPFSQLSTFHRDQYDAWQTDLECPITNNVVPYRTQVDLLVFNCRPEFLPEATKFFNLINLANNHTDNQGGMTGLAETRAHLKAAGVQYFGNFDPGVSQDVCEVVGLPVRVQETGKADTHASLPVAICAWHYVFRMPRAGEIDVMKRYAQIMPVFAFVHMGREYIPKAETSQESVLHQIADNGPEFVIGNQSHWVQNTEVYKGKLIVYSTGNFIFDQLDNETNRGDNISVKLWANSDANLKKWLAMGPECQTYQDNCIDHAESGGLQKVKLNLDYSVVASQGGYKLLTHRADAATQAAVEQRMNWTQTCQSLALPYGCETNSGL